METPPMLQLDARKKEALERFLERMREGRGRRDLPESASEAYLLGLREGYGDGFVDGMVLGTKVSQEAEGGFDSPEVGAA